MNIFEMSLGMMALLALRLAFPLIATLLFGYGMNRIVDRWIARDEP